MIKWRLLWTTLPFVILMLGLAYVRDYVLHLRPLVVLGDVTEILAAVSLILGLMLAGVLSDYKDSEKTPGDLAVSLESLGDAVEAATSNGAAKGLKGLRLAMKDLVFTVDDWLARRVELDALDLSMDHFRKALRAAGSDISESLSGRCLDALQSLRPVVMRADVIMHTSFLPAGYALMYLLVAVTLVLLLAAEYPSPSAEYLLVAALSLIYIFMLRLVRDLDDPFGYGTSKRRGGSAEVNPYPVVRYRLKVEEQFK
jgi:hypothetical protein